MKPIGIDLIFLSKIVSHPTNNGQLGSRWSRNSADTPLTTLHVLKNSIGQYKFIPRIAPLNQASTIQAFRWLCPGIRNNKTTFSSSSKDTEANNLITMLALFFPAQLSRMLIKYAGISVPQTQYLSNSSSSFLIRRLHSA